MSKSVRTIDLHHCTVEEARAKLQSFIRNLGPEVKEVVVIHGFNQGNRILEMVRNEYRSISVRINSATPSFMNSGSTRYILKNK